MRRLTGRQGGRSSVVGTARRLQCRGMERALPDLQRRCARSGVKSRDVRPVTYLEEYDPHLQERVRTRYASEAQALEALGFRELCCYSEVLGNYSLLLYLPVVLLMRAKREVLSRRPRLQTGASYLLHHHPQPDTVALPLGLGVKFYTSFSDGTIVVTASFESMAVPRSGSQVLKTSENMSIPEAWQRHKERVAETGLVHTISRSHGFAAFVAMAQQEERSAVVRGSYDDGERRRASG
jgi:hypothetical protein